MKVLSEGVKVIVTYNTNVSFIYCLRTVISSVSNFFQHKVKVLVLIRKGDRKMAIFQLTKFVFCGSGYFIGIRRYI